MQFNSILFIMYFSMKYDRLGTAFGYWWLSTSLYSVSIYVADARSRVLPLIGGQGGHDWAYLLNRFDLLTYDMFISKVICLGAWVAIVMSIIYIARYIRLYEGRIIS